MSKEAEVLRPLERVSMASKPKEGSGFELWRETCRPLLDVVSRTQLPSFKTAFEFYNVDGILFNRTQYSAVSFKRNDHFLRSGEGDFIAIHMLLNGNEVGLVEGREFHKNPQRIVIQDWAHAFESSAEASEQICVVIPRERLSVSDQFYEKHPVVELSRNSPQGLILSNAMLSTWDALPLAGQSDASTIAASFLGLLEGLLAPSHVAKAYSITSRATVAAMQQFLTKNLHNPALNVNSLTSAFKCSRATTFRLFKDFGGVRGFISEQRLNEAYRIISESGQHSTSISNIALSIGFSDVGYFHRLFKKRFGMTASEARDVQLDLQTAMALDAVTNSEDNSQLQKLHDWLVVSPTRS